MTGLAQLADLLFKTARLCDRAAFLPPARRIMSFLRSCIDTTSGDTGVRGGLQASYPIAGGYGPYTINNWGVKYFLDATGEEIAAIDGRHEGQG